MSGPQFSTPTPFQPHLQQSNHASPSPNPSQQAFRPPSSQPHMSPPPNFPGQGGHPGSFNQMPNQMNRMPGSQNPSQYMGGMPAGQGLHPGAHGAMGAGGPQMAGQFPNMRAAMHGNMGQQQHEFAQRQYQQSLMRQQQMHRSMGQMPPGGQANGLRPQQQAAMAGGGMKPNMPGRPNFPQNVAQDSQMQSFMMQLEKFAQQRGQALDPNPTVCGRRVNYWAIFSQYLKIRPSNQDAQGWANLAAQLDFNPTQQPTAVQELRAVFDRNLSAFCLYYMSTVQQRQKQMQARLPGQGSPTSDGVPRPPVPPPFPNRGPQTGPSNAGSPSINQRKSAPSMPDGLGSTTPEKPGSSLGQSSSPHHFPQGSPVQLKVDSHDEPEEKVKANGTTHLDGVTNDEDANKPFDPEYKPRRYEVVSFGGVSLDALAENGAAVYDMKTYQRFEELGPVDLHSLTMGLQSGFDEEIRFALDRLAALSQRPLLLSECEDLVDTLVKIGQEQATKLTESVGSHSDTQRLLSYDNLSTSCRGELSDVHEGLDFGSKGHEQQHMADTLIAITTILRNLSFPLSPPERFERENESNRKILSSAVMQSFWVKIMKLLTLDSSPLQNKRDMLDIMKDLVVLLSNVAEALIIVNEEDARALLGFLLAFAPRPTINSRFSTISFTSYEPLKHQYLPNALDSLAKILARDDPNRGFLKSIFHSDVASADKTALPLITQAFALAIAPVPDSVFESPSLWAPIRLMEKRMPIISQGMLTLDILSTLIPTPTGGHSSSRHTSVPLQKQWLTSDDGWVTRLIHLVVPMASRDAEGTERHPVTKEPIYNARESQSITQRALSMIYRLVESADKIELDSGEEKSNLLSSRVLGPVPLEHMVVSAMRLPRFDSETLKCLSALSRLVP